MRDFDEGRPFFIYALVCPLTLEVKYVGQTIDLEQRVRGKRHSTSLKAPLAAWLRTLGYLRPYKIILERGINRRVNVPATSRDHVRGRRPIGERTMWLSSVQETKWIKRFRKTILNQRGGSVDVDRLLTNPPLPWEVNEPS